MNIKTDKSLLILKNILSDKNKTIAADQRKHVAVWPLAAKISYSTDFLGAKAPLQIASVSQ